MNCWAIIGCPSGTRSTFPVSAVVLPARYTAAMDDNPYESPREPLPPQRRPRKTVVFWILVAICAPLALASGCFAICAAMIPRSEPMFREASLFLAVVSGLLAGGLFIIACTHQSWCNNRREK